MNGFIEENKKFLFLKFKVESFVINLDIVFKFLILNGIGFFS